MLNIYNKVLRNLRIFFRLFLMLVMITCLEQVILIPLEVTADSKNFMLNILLTFLSFSFQILFIYQLNRFCIKSKLRYKYLTSYQLIFVIFVGIICVIIWQFGFIWLEDIGLFPLNQRQNALVSIMDNNPVGLYIYVCFFGPILEELIFRKYFISKFIFMFGYSRISKFFAVFLSSILFALGHNQVFSLMTSIPFVGMGLILSILYLKSENVLVPILAHICANLIGVL